MVSITSTGVERATIEANALSGPSFYSTNDARHATTAAPNPAPNLQPLKAPAPTAASFLFSKKPRFRVVTVVVDDSELVTFLSSCVGNMVGVVETWNMGFIGEPSNENRCSLGPSVASRNIRQLRTNSVIL